MGSKIFPWSFRIAVNNTKAAHSCLLIILYFWSLNVHSDAADPTNLAGSCNSTCKFYSECRATNGIYECECPKFCFASQEPVCGSDGKNYSTECHLRALACQKKVLVVVKHKGLCGTKSECSEKKCKYFSVCKVDNNGNSFCVCPKNCNYHYSPICGSDGKTYRNECFMQMTSCHEQREIIKKHEEVCEKPGKCPKVTTTCGIQKQHCTLDEMCSGSMKCCLTSSCTLNCTNAVPGPCTHCEPLGLYCGVSYINGSIQCVSCPGWCPTDKEMPLCGSNGKTYFSQCFFDMEKCTLKNKLSVAYNGSCHHMRQRGQLIVGISVGVSLFVLLLIVGLCVFFYRRRKLKSTDRTVEIPFIDGDSL